MGILKTQDTPMSTRYERGVEEVNLSHEHRHADRRVATQHTSTALAQSSIPSKRGSWRETITTTKDNFTFFFSPVFARNNTTAIRQPDLYHLTGPNDHGYYRPTGLIFRRTYARESFPSQLCEENDAITSARNHHVRPHSFPAHQDY